MSEKERKSLTLWQRAILFTLFAAEEKWRDNVGDDSGELELIVSRRGFELSLWFDWQTYHTKATGELIALGWLEKRWMPSRITSYALTAAGRSSLSQNASGLLAHSKMQRIGQAPF